MASRKLESQLSGTRPHFDRVGAADDDSAGGVFREGYRADDLAARKPIAVPSDGSGSFSYAESEKTPIVTPESWGKADDGTGFGLR